MTMNSQTWASLSPPVKIAGPRLRAGLTDTPVTGMKTTWMTASVRPMTSPPAGTAAPVNCVMPRITAVKMNVPMISARMAEPMPNSPL